MDGDKLSMWSLVLSVIALIGIIWYHISYAGVTSRATIGPYVIWISLLLAIIAFVKATWVFVKQKKFSLDSYKKYAIIGFILSLVVIIYFAYQLYQSIGFRIN